MLKNRGIYILKRLLEGKTAFSLTDLADELSISSRAVRYELDEIDYFLKCNGFPCLIRKNKSGIGFAGNKAERCQVLKLLEESGAYGRILSQEERMFTIFYRLLTTNEYITTQKLADELFVSRSTVMNDLNKIKRHYPFESAEIQTVAHYGMKLKGKEEDIRDSVVDFMQKYVKIEEVLRSIKNVSDKKSRKEVSSLDYIFKDIHYASVDFCIKKIECRTNRIFPDHIYLYLFSSISVMLLRIKEYGRYEGGAPVEAEDQKNREILKMIICDIETTSGLFLSSFDKYYAGKMLNSILCDGNLAYKNINYIDKQVVMLDFIDSVGKSLEVDFIKDKILIDTLNTDICTILNKDRHPLEFNEDVHSYVLKLCPDILPVVRASLPVLEKGIGICLNENWLNHIASIFVEALQRYRPLVADKKEVLIVCASGQITSRLLNYRLNAIFEVNVVDIIPYNQLEEYTKHIEEEILIISTIPLDTKSYIKVSPTLTPEDISLLKQYLPTRVIDYNLLAKIMDAVTDNCQITNYKALYDSLLDILGFREYHRNFERPLLEDIIRPENIVIEYGCDNWWEAVEASGSILMKNGYIKKEYIDDIMDTLEEKREYVVISKGIALPHARSFNHVNRIGMSILRLKKPVRFGNKFNDPVEFVFVFCTTDNTSHLEALRQFNIMISDEEILKELRKATKKEQITELIKRVSRL